MTIGLARPDEPEPDARGKLEVFTFSPAKAGIYQLGDFGTAREKLEAWELMP